MDDELPGQSWVIMRVLHPQTEQAEDDAEKPLVLVVSEDDAKVNEIKAILGDRYKGVYLRSEERARKFLSNHSVKFVIREENQK